MKKYMVMMCVALVSVMTYAESMCTADRLTQIIQKDPTMDVGVSVLNTETGHVLFQYNAHQVFTPASNAKLLTAVAALTYLKPTYRYQTRLWRQNNLTGSIYHGNLYLEFQGDPSFTDGDLADLLSALKREGIREIDGNIFVVGDRFRLPEVAPGVTVEDMFWDYGAPIDTVILNENQIQVRIYASQLNQATRFALVSPPIGVSLAGTEVSAVPFSASMTDCSLLVHQTDQNAITLGGCWPAHQGEQTLNFAIQNPDYFVSAWVSTLLKNRHIVLHGQVSMGHMPAVHHFTLVAAHSSDPLNILLKTMLQNSDNVYANAVLKTLGAQYYGVGSYQMGSKAMKHILLKLVPVQGPFAYELVDGAGLSRYDLISPLFFTQLLLGVYRSSFREDFFSLLPEAGTTGTLRSRFGLLQGKLFAKTGTLEHTSTLSGFLDTANQGTVVFSIMIDHILPNAKHARGTMNALLQCLAEM